MLWILQQHEKQNEDISKGANAFNVFYCIFFDYNLLSKIQCCNEILYTDFSHFFSHRLCVSFILKIYITIGDTHAILKIRHNRFHLSQMVGLD